MIDFDYYREKFSEEGLKPSKPNSWKAIKAKAIKYRNDWLENVKVD